MSTSSRIHPNSGSVSARHHTTNATANRRAASFSLGNTPTPSPRFNGTHYSIGMNEQNENETLTCWNRVDTNTRRVLIKGTFIGTCCVATIVAVTFGIIYGIRLFQE